MEMLRELEIATRHANGIAPEMVRLELAVDGVVVRASDRSIDKKLFQGTHIIAWRELHDYRGGAGVLLVTHIDRVVEKLRRAIKPVSEEAESVQSVEAHLRKK